MITLRPLEEGDFSLLVEWLGRDHVLAWWREPLTMAGVVGKYLPRIRGEEPTQVYVIVVDGRSVGIIQRYRIDNYPEWQQSLRTTGFDPAFAAGIDYLIGDPEYLGRGIATAAISMITAMIFADFPDVEAVAVTPQAANAGSCRVLEKAGYELRWVGILDSDDPSDAGEAALYLKRRPCT